MKPVDSQTRVDLSSPFPACLLASLGWPCLARVCVAHLHKSGKASSARNWRVGGQVLLLSARRASARHLYAPTRAEQQASAAAGCSILVLATVWFGALLRASRSSRLLVLQSWSGPWRLGWVCEVARAEQWRRIVGPFSQGDAVQLAASQAFVARHDARCFHSSANVFSSGILSAFCCP